MEQHDELDVPPGLDWEAYLSYLRREMADDKPDSPEREAEFRLIKGEVLWH